jgi:hypothetical protein
MATDNPSSASQEKPTLEMRLAAIEDKLAGMTVTPEELAAYHKVAALAGGHAQGGAAPALSPQVCSISPIVSNCYHCWNCWNCWINPIRPIGPIVNDCILYSPGPTSGGGFGRLGG